MDRVAKRQAEALAAGRPGLAAIALDAFKRDERVLHERRRQVVLGDLGERLEDLEVMPPQSRPEHHMGFDRRAAGTAQATSDTITVSSSASAKRARVQSRTRSSAARGSGLFLPKQHGSNGSRHGLSGVKPGKV